MEDRYKELLVKAAARIEQLEAEVRRLRQGGSVAVTGIGLRFPGNCSSAESFWKLLESEGKAIRGFPRERWQGGTADAFDAAFGRIYGGFLSEQDDFQAADFDIPSEEASVLDPQQKLLLQVTRDALRDAGIDPKSLSGSQAGVFIGVSTVDHQKSRVMSGDLEKIDKFALTGAMQNACSGRISFVFGFRGPSLSIDAACSSSLVAVHQGIQALRAGECDLAIVGGVNVMTMPEITLAYSRVSKLSKDGQCRPFSADAEGYVRGEGCGVLLLERHADAVRNKRRVHAILRGSAIGHVGRSSGFTTPNRFAQGDVIRRALDDAGVDAGSIGYVEAQGTGTKIGDVIEIQALAEVFAGREHPVLVGSLKPNIGHLEAASGVAGLIKAILCMRQDKIPASLNALPLNTDIEWDKIPIEVCTGARAFPGSGETSFAGVTSIGFNGTNAHVIVERGDALAPAAETTATQTSAGSRRSEAGGIRKLPMTSVQRRLFTLCQMPGGELAYHLPDAYRIRGRFDIEQSKRSLAKMIQHHEALRTGFELTDDGEFVQVIHPDAPLQFFVRDATEEDLPRLIEESVTPFDLAVPPLFRTFVFRLGPDEYLVLADYHHLIFDAASSNILVISTRLLAQGRGLPERQRQYADFQRWQEEFFKSPEIRQQERFWLKQMEGELPVLQLPVDCPRTEVQSFRGDNVLVTHDVAALQEMASQRGSTLFMVLLSAYYALLARCSGQEDIAVGTVHSARSTGGFNDVIGMFVNTLVLRNAPALNKTFAQFLSEIRAKVLEVLENADYPFEFLVERTGAGRDHSRNPLFDASISFENVDSRLKDEFDGAKIEPYTFRRNFSLFDLDLVIYQAGRKVLLRFGYRVDLFRRETIERLAGYYVRILDCVAKNPETTLGDIPILDDEEQRRLLDVFASAGGQTDISQTVLALFAASAKQHREKIAVIAEDRPMTYGELDESSDDLAARLVALCEGRENQRIAVLLPRGERMAVAVLGVLKAGYAYVPMDVKFPPERIAYMLGDSECAVLLTDNPRQRQLPVFGGTILDMGAETSSGATTLPPAPRLDQAAYVIYTSGSTGRPKGTVIEHRGLANYLLWAVAEYRVAEGSGAPVHSSLSFDATITSFFTPLLSGRTVWMIPEDGELDRLAELLQTEKNLSLIKVTPSHLDVLERLVDPARIANCVRAFVIGGEALRASSLEFWRAHLPATRFINEYGPTETVVGCCTYEVASGDPHTGEVLIGRPIANTSIDLLDASLRLVPTGAVGEICISGSGVARGYINRQEVASKQFVENPLRPRERMYRTGDLGRWRSDGNLEFLGRIDDQVKIRGHRVECGEVQDVLARLPGVKQAVVVAWPKPGESLELAAYFVPEYCLDPGDLRNQMARVLPEAMLPARFIAVDEIPLSSSGKVDRSQLPDPLTNSLQPNKNGPGPRTELERDLAAIWEEVLGTDHVGRDDNFFELGGHSLKGVQVVSRVRGRLRVEMQLQDVFLAPTIATLADTIRHRRAAELPALAPLPDQNHYEVSHAQRRLWILDHFESKKSIAYNVASALRLKGPLKREAFEDALRSVLNRHDVFKTVFLAVAGEPRQKILPSASFTLEQVDLRRELDVDQALRDQTHAFVRQPFDLAAGPLFKARLLEISDDHRILLTNIHHIISDAWSVQVFILELAALYNGRVAGRDVTLPPLRIQYKEYAAWQNRLIRSVTAEPWRKFWHEELAGQLPVLDLVTDYPRPVYQAYEGSSLVFSWSEELRDGLKTLARELKGSLFMVLEALVKVLLHRYTAQNDLIVGTPVLNRDHLDFENQIGFFLNTLALRSRIHGEMRAAQFISNEIEKITRAFEHQSYPFDRLIDELSLARDLSRSPVFDVMVIVLSEEKNSFHLSGLEVEPLAIETGTSKVDLLFGFYEHSKGISCFVEFNTALFKMSRIDRMKDHLGQLARGIVANPAARICDLELMQEDERALITQTFNRTDSPVRENVTAAALIAERAGVFPDAVAVICGDERVSYRELLSRADRISAALLSRAETKPEAVIGIRMVRSPWMVAALVGVSRAGCAYLPLEPSLPDARTHFLLEDSGCRTVITAGLVEQAAAWADGISVINAERLRDPAPDFKPVQPAPDSLAYIMYTSGSTGEPKGVLIEHSSLAEYVQSFSTAFSITESDRVLGHISLSFDASVEEIYPILVRGGTLVMAQDANEFGELLSLIVEQEITVISTTPPFVDFLNRNARRLKSVRTLISGGDRLQAASISRLHRRIKLFNTYGPTESTVCATYAEITQPDPDAPLPIGRPIANRQVYIVDGFLNPLPIGVQGELIIGGAGLARGYLNRDEETRTRFAAVPFLPGRTLYRSGDRGYWLEDGQIIFAGRNDGQVKIRGYRIECEEVAAQVRKMQQVSQAVVTARRAKTGEEVLACYYVPAYGHDAAESAIPVATFREHLGKSLPAYMIPSHFVSLDRVPVTVAGKVDFRRLPEPEVSRAAGGAIVKPRSEVEAQVAVIWTEILGLERVSVLDDFFEIGGHSMKAVQLMYELEKVGISTDVRTLFQYPTIASFTEYVMSRPDGTIFIRLTVDRAKKIFACPPVFGLGVFYQILANYCSEAGFYAFDFSERKDLLDCYVDSVMELQPQGPIWTLGYSAGGRLAFEVTRRLERLGADVRALVLFDAPFKPEISGRSVAELIADMKLVDSVVGWGFEEEEQFRKFVDSGYLKEKMRGRMAQYMKFNEGIRIEEQLKADIHLIRSESNRENLDLLRWSRITRGKFTVHEGAGPHNAMMYAAHAPANARILSAIVGQNQGEPVESECRAGLS